MCFKRKLLSHSDSHVKTFLLFLGGIVSYTTSDASIPDLIDISYDGKKENSLLTDGLGCLVDGEIGADNYKQDLGNRKGNRWVDTHAGMLKISFNNFNFRLLAPVEKVYDFYIWLIIRAIENIIFRSLHCRKLCFQRILIMFRNFVAWIRSEKFVFHDINFLLLRFTINKDNFKKLLPRI